MVNRLEIFVKSYPRLVLTLATIALLLPFAGKAFHIDDPLFIWAGRHMRSHPLDPYGFEVNWSGTAMAMADVTKNPPLASAYIALLSSIFGEREFWLHVGFMAQAVAVVLGTYTLAGRFCKRPFYAALATLLTPVFLVSSTTLMCDVLMLALWIWAMIWWLRAIDTNKPVSFIWAGLLVGACGLTKYFGIALFPLLFSYSLFKTRGFGRWLVYLLIPIAMWGLYHWWTLNLYGKGLLFDAAIYAKQTSSLLPMPFAFELFTVLAFTGGCFVIVLIFTPFLWPSKVWITFAVGALSFLIFTRGPWPYAFYFQWVVLLIGGVALIALSLLDFKEQRDTHSLILLLWILGTLLFCAVNWTLNARSLLPMGPAVAIVLVRRIERGNGSAKPRYLSIAFGIAGLISVLIAYADYQLANTARLAAEQIRETLGTSSRIWFQGHWGFQYYAQARGLRAFDMKYSEIQPGDFMVIPGGNVNRVLVPSDMIPAGMIRKASTPLLIPEDLMAVPRPNASSVNVIPSSMIDFVTSIQEFPCSWITTMNETIGAGFYAAWGPLPFVFGPVPPEKYRVIRFR